MVIMVVTMKTRLLLMRVMMMRTALCWSSAELTFDSWRVFSAIFTYLLSTSTYPFPPDTTLTHNQYLTICIFQNYSLNPTWLSTAPIRKDGQILQKEILQKKDCWARYTYIALWANWNCILRGEFWHFSFSQYSSSPLHFSPSAAVV